MPAKTFSQQTAFCFMCPRILRCSVSHVDETTLLQIDSNAVETYSFAVVLIANIHRLILSTDTLFHAQAIKHTPTVAVPLRHPQLYHKCTDRLIKKFILGGFQALTSFFLPSSVRYISTYYLMITLNDTYTFGRTQLEGIDSSQRRLPDKRQHC